MTTPDTRLHLAADFVRQDAIFADVGTDHAYLPAFLLETNKIRAALCTDIHEEPLALARRNLDARGLSARATFILADGLCGVEASDVTDVAICGMGGDTIAHVLDGAPQIRRAGVRVIVQPMSHFGVARDALGRCGFAVTAEGYCRAAGRAYVTLCADYDGAVRVLGDVARELGDVSKIVCGKDVFLEIAGRKIGAARARVQSRRAAGRDTAADEAFIEAATRLAEQVRQEINR